MSLCYDEITLIKKSLGISITKLEMLDIYCSIFFYFHFISSSWDLVAKESISSGSRAHAANCMPGSHVGHNPQTYPTRRKTQNILSCMIPIYSLYELGSWWHGIPILL